MTIVAGFHTDSGILICTDSEYSGTGVTVPKRKTFDLTLSDILSCVFAFSGNADLALPVIQRSIHELSGVEWRSIPSHRDVANAVKDIVDEEYQRHVKHPVENTTDTAYQLLFGVWTQRDNCGLYSTWRGAVQQHPFYYCIGQSWLGDLLLPPLVHFGSNVEWARILGTYIVMQAKRRADGCGGPTQIATLRTNGVIEYVGLSETEKTERALAEMFQQFNSSLFATASEDEEEFCIHLAAFVRGMLFARLDLGKISIPDMNDVNADVARLILQNPPSPKKRASRRPRLTTADPLPPPPSRESPGGSDES